MLRLYLKPLLLLLLLAAAARPGQAQEGAVLYAGLIKSKGYVVGSPLSASGLHRFEGDTTWTHLGWNTPRIVGITYDPRNPDILFLASGNGCLRTMDGGASWRLTTDWRITETQDVSVDPNRPDHVYLATAYGVWRTTDQGETWAEASHGIPSPSSTYTDAIKVDRTQAGRVLAGTWGGLYLTTDGAQSWTPVGPRDVPIHDLHQSPTNPSVWIAGTLDKGVLLSDDGGLTWRFARGRIAEQSIYGVAIDPLEARHMAAVGWDTGVYVTTNGGASWKRHTRGLPSPHFYEVIFDANIPGRIQAATVEEGLYLSDDDGRTWQSAGLYGTMIFDLIFINRGAP